MRLLLGVTGLVATLWVASAVSAQSVGDHPLRLLEADWGTYVLLAPDGSVAACGIYPRDGGAIDVGWWRGPGTYRFIADFAATHAETTMTLDGAEYDVMIGATFGFDFGLVSTAWRQTPQVRARWVDDGHLDLFNDTDHDLTAGIAGGSVFWEHRPAERGLTPAERERRSLGARDGCGSGWGNVVVPAHGSVRVGIGITRVEPGAYHGAIRLSDLLSGAGFVATFEVRVVADRVGTHLTHR
jgi:hypothetical protein